jgi:hypothetical protein
VRSRLDQIIDLTLAQVKLSRVIDWHFLGVVRIGLFGGRECSPLPTQLLRFSSVTTGSRSLLSILLREGDEARRILPSQRRCFTTDACPLNGAREPPVRLPLKRDGFRLNRHRAPDLWWSVIFSENRYPLFRIML